MLKKKMPNKILLSGKKGIGKSTLEKFTKNGADIIACSKNHNIDLLDYYSQI